MATRMIQRRGTAAEWTAANPVLAAGEIGFETDTTKFKFGDGVTAWADITYFASADALIDGAPELLDTLNELAAAIGDDENFITTITTDIDSKLPLAGGTISGNLIVQSDATVGGALNVSEPVNPNHATTKEYVDDLVNPVSLDVTTLQSSVSGIESTLTTINTNISSNDIDIAALQGEQSELRRTFRKSSTPTSADNGGNAIEEGALWYNDVNGHLYLLLDLDGGTTYVWAEVNGNGTTHDFPTAPADGDTHNGFIYDSTNNVWNVDRSTEIADNTDVTISSIQDEHVLMYNSSSSQFENVQGVKLDVDGEIPTTYAGKIQALIATDIASAESGLVGGATTYTTLGEIETYLGSALFTDVPALTVKSAADWGTDTSTPLSGSVNVETGGAEILVKIGNGTDTYANLDYIPSNAGITAEIATALASYAPKADPTFSGTVSLPSTTSIGDVDATEIAHLDGVTSGIQGQLDSLDTLKAPIADPTFTGTVSGVTASMVGLGSVDNTADADKPVSTATQAALDLKANLSGATFGGSVVIEGDLTVSGATTTVYASDLSVRDNMIYLNQGGYFTVTAATGDGANVTYTTDEDHAASVGEYITVTGADPATFDISGDGLEITAVTANTITVASTVTDTFVSGGNLRVKSHANPDLGWSAGRYDVVNGSGYGHAGIFRDATDGVFKVYDGYVPEPDESVFIDTTDASFALAPVAVGKVVFPDGTEQSAAGVPSLTTFTEKTASYTLDTLDHKDNIVEMNMSEAGTFTIPTDAALSWPVGASMDVFATGTGEITIAGDTGVTVNATPGLILRTQWSSATLLKRGANNWVVYGDLKA